MNAEETLKYLLTRYELELKSAQEHAEDARVKCKMVVLGKARVKVDTLHMIVDDLKSACE